MPKQTFIVVTHPLQMKPTGRSVICKQASAAAGRDNATYLPERRPSIGGLRPNRMHFPPAHHEPAEQPVTSRTGPFFTLTDIARTTFDDESNHVLISPPCPSSAVRGEHRASAAPTFTPHPLAFTELGMTLIEMLVAVGILVILAMIAAPSFQAQIAKNRLTDASNELFQSLNRARTEAIRLGRRVTVCKSLNGQTCDTSSSGWEKGWIVFIDTNHSGTSPSVDAGETITFKVGALAGVVIKGNSNLAYVSYAADGRPKLLNGGMFMGTLRVCSPSNALKDGERARDLIISSSGRIRVSTPNSVDSSCPAP